MFLKLITYWKKGQGMTGQDLVIFRIASNYFSCNSMILLNRLVITVQYTLNDVLMEGISCFWMTMSQYLTPVRRCSFMGIDDTAPNPRTMLLNRISSQYLCIYLRRCCHHVNLALWWRVKRELFAGQHGQKLPWHKWFWTVQGQARGMSCTLDVSVWNWLQICVNQI